MRNRNVAKQLEAKLNKVLTGLVNFGLSQYDRHFSIDSWLKVHKICGL